MQTIEQFARAHQLSLVITGGLFVLDPQHKGELAAGSGGATCADYLRRRLIGWSPLSVNLCTAPDQKGWGL